MRYVADLHIHSPFSRATSPRSTLEGLALAARRKGVSVLATGDGVHPRWFDTLRESLVEVESGFFALKKDDAGPPVRFVLSTEISSIYSRGGRGRRVHNLFYFPDMESLHRFSGRLLHRGLNLASDGRPIVGLDCRDLFEIFLDTVPGGFMVPAHVWTPWFSLLGSRSGFDGVEDCFGDLTPQIFALETGLSSDPAMNRLVSSLDRYTLISNSDSHSPEMIGREANILATGFDFHSLREAIRGGTRDRFYATVEFFPEEGKYHADGHRPCGVRLDPEETKALGGRCPVCGGKVTVGVLSRVKELADRNIPHFPDHSPLVFSLIPLVEILAEIRGEKPASRGVIRAYGELVTRFESELAILLDRDPADLSSYDERLGEAVRRLRAGAVTRIPGYDGQYGTIRLFDEV
ncbi:MAG: hypothetical protein Fur0034_19740 [Desulfuromonadia bacterium]